MRKANLGHLSPQTQICGAATWWACDPVAPQDRVMGLGFGLVVGERKI